MYHTYVWYIPTVLLYTICLMMFESPNRDRAILYIEITHQRHIRIRIDKNVILFGNHFPEPFCLRPAAGMQQACKRHAEGIQPWNLLLLALSSDLN